MSYRYEKETGDLVFDGFEKGIAPSPHQGIANLQGVNLQTEMGEAMCSYTRVQQSQAPITNGTFMASTSTIVTYAGAAALRVGATIQVTISTITGLSTTFYWVQQISGNQITLQTNIPGTATAVSGLGITGTATFNTVNLNTPVQGCFEQYLSGSSTFYRYYILTNSGYVWCNDTGLTIFGINPGWFLIDTSSIAPNNNAAGIGILNGYVHVFVESTIYCKETALLGVNSLNNLGWDTFIAGQMNTQVGSLNSHFAITSQNNTLTYCDGPFLGTIQSSSNSGSSTTAPLWSYGTYTFSGSTLTITSLIGGSLPLVNSTITFTSSGTNPLTTNQLYYVKSITKGATNATMTVSTTVGGAAVTPSGGTGTFYFNTYQPTQSGTASTYIFSPQALTLPFTAVSQSICEIGNTIVIGTQSNFIYFWDEFDPLPTNFIPLPENNSVYMINVNNMAYIFAGNKGNIYITNGSTASAAISVPDYCAGIPGTPTSYIEPYFIWGGAAYIRGRVYFSIQDQTASKTGNCGGVWSFVPTQNLFAGEDVGLTLRLEAQNSYGTYNGVTNIILNSQTQNVIGPQYYTAWTSSISGPSYGIDGSGTTPFLGGAKIETDCVPTGTVLGQQKKTFSNIEIKLAAPLATGESVAVNYRQNITDAWATAGIATTEPTNPQSVIVSPLAFQNTQWLQLQGVLTSTNSAPSFVRVIEMRVRTT